MDDRRSLSVTLSGLLDWRWSSNLWDRVRLSCCWALTRSAMVLDSADATRALSLETLALSSATRASALLTRASSIAMSSSTMAAFRLFMVIGLALLRSLDNCLRAERNSCLSSTNWSSSLDRRSLALPSAASSSLCSKDL
jgi:hypothetical protein